MICCLILSGCVNPSKEDTPDPLSQLEEKTADNLSKSLNVDVSHLTSVDGQPLLKEPVIKQVPQPPGPGVTYEIDDSAYWFDQEYFFTVTEKVNIPQSPKDGAFGKKVINIVNGNHPYMTAYGIGAKKIADAYGMTFSQYSSDWQLDIQNRQVDQAIAEKPDMIIINPLDVKVALSQLKKINNAGIPCIVSNMVPDSEAMKYVLAWTGPDDWGQFRELARVLADALEGKGGVAFLTHSVGGSVYYSRMMAPITELKTYAPDMVMLDSRFPGFDRLASKEVVAGWLETYGDDLNAIVCADDATQILGAIDAVKEGGREDVIIVAAGNSKEGMDAVKRGDVFALTYQSAQADGAMAMKVAADWFNGLEIPEVSFMQTHIITSRDVDDYMPAEW